MAEIWLALGTNLGEREHNLATAMALLEKALGVSPKAVSETLNTQACGFDGPDFLNCIAVFETRRRPQTILNICKRIERQMGRNEVIEYDENGQRIFHNRIIDIDILLYGDKTVNTPSLTIPHPQIATRPYVKTLMQTLSKSGVN